jgi:hypothetical protein
MFQNRLYSIGRVRNASDADIEPSAQAGSMKLPHCGNFGIEILLSPFLIWVSTNDWLASAGERWACPLTELSL